MKNLMHNTSILKRINSSRIPLLACLSILFAGNANADDINGNITDSLSNQSVNVANSTTLRFPEQIQRKKLHDTQKIYVLGSGERADANSDSVRSLMDIFYADQYRTFLDPEAPTFMLMSKDAHLALGVGGTLTMRGWFDWNGAIPDYVYAPYNIPIPKNPAKMKELRATAANSGFYLTLLGRNTKVGDFFAYLEGGFRGYGRTDFTLRRAYIRVKGFTAGYALTTFLDPGAIPAVADGGTAHGTIDRANILVRYQKDFKSGWSVAGAVEFPNTQIADDTENTEAASQFIPDIAGFGQYSWDEGFSHIRLSGLLRTLSYRDLIQQKNHNKIGWGISLSTAIKIVPNLTFYGVGIYGAGHNGYLSDLSFGAHDLVGIANEPGVLQIPRAFSYLVGLKYNFRPNLYATGSFSQLRNYEKNPIDKAGYKYGICATINFFWEITPRLMIGGEYIYGKRANFNAMTGSSDRVEAIMQLSF